MISSTRSKAAIYDTSQRNVAIYRIAFGNPTKSHSFSTNSHEQKAQWKYPASSVQSNPKHENTRLNPHSKSNLDPMTSSSTASSSPSPASSSPTIHPTVQPTNEPNTPTHLNTSPHLNTPPPRLHPPPTTVSPSVVASTRVIQIPCPLPPLSKPCIRAVRVSQTRPCDTLTMTKMKKKKKKNKTCSAI